MSQVTSSSLALRLSGNFITTRSKNRANWASWCGPCKFISPAFNAMAEKFDDVSFVKLDVDELKDVAKEFNVTAMPTFVLFKKGKEIDRIIGAKKDELESKISKHRA